MDPSHYEEDHLVALEIGGDGKDPKNLWPEPHEWKDNSFDKDKIENWLHRQVCSGAMTFITQPAAQGSLGAGDFLPVHGADFLALAERDKPAYLG
jgi:hypothetical protein